MGQAMKQERFLDKKEENAAVFDRSPNAKNAVADSEVDFSSFTDKLERFYSFSFKAFILFGIPYVIWVVLQAINQFL
ncbi:hypothetical protein [Texcoconibacillus texcoconensis]|uniref:Uncharacterized protein n=1 Tax=Texcoconibacillus texcoconensis TaxID=1095777 RepID=A0A840QSU6_9BACI|nr:hypothetical protein [Texcoconibacillus texcoconensis]MBB5174361.1 hypothetical protein [Texcoconibacillus texcoconensis]